MKRDRKRDCFAPPLVRNYLRPNQTLRQYMAVDSFERGVAESGDFDVLLDCADMLLLAAHHKKDMGEEEVAHMARMALANIRDRYLKSRKLGVTGEERKALRVLVEISEDFWKRQGAGLHNAAVEGLRAVREKQKSNNVVAK